jgi:hypothetical protein
MAASTPSVGMWRFLAAELALAFSSSARIAREMGPPEARAPYRGLVPTNGEVPARFVRLRRLIAATYATLALLLPVAITLGVTSMWWTRENFADPLAIAITIFCILMAGLVAVPFLAVLGLLFARLAVAALVARANSRSDPA